MGLAACAIIVMATFVSPHQAQVCWEGGEYILDLNEGAQNRVPFNYVVEHNGDFSVLSATGTWYKFVNPSHTDGRDNTPIPDDEYDFNPWRR